MATAFPATLSNNNQYRLPLVQSPSPFNSSRFSSSSRSSSSCSLSLRISSWKHSRPQYKGFKVECSSVRQPLKVMISGAPASGKGTQCKLIVEKYGLVHISTGDLLRAEVSSKTEIGKKAKEYMDNGKLVPDEIVTDMVVARLSRQDAREKGWLLDGYPRSYSQAQSLESMKIRPDIYIILEVLDEILIDRCVGRRLDPITGKIYHIKSFPPENEEIASRLIIRSDDTLEKAKSRLETYKQNAEAILPTYVDLLHKIDGNREREAVFQDIDSLLQKINENDSSDVKVGKTNENASKSITKLAPKNVKWRGIPTKLNNIPHSREIREYFYEDIRNATNRAVYDRKTRLKVEINIPELNPELDVYRIGTLMEMVRNLAFSFADDGKRVKVCVQGAMGEGSFAGIPMQLAGTRKILEYMDWGDDGALGDFINIGAIGAEEVNERDDMFILVAPQNAVGNCIMDDLEAMMEAAGDRPVILINPQLKDLPSSSGVMTTIGREERMKFASSFETCYLFRLLYYAGSFFPIMGALRMSHPNAYELYKRIDGPNGKEEYVILAEFPNKPTSIEINDAFTGRKRNKEQGIWGFLSGIL